MKTIVFNALGSTLDRSVEAATLKAGYLLGDVIYTAGSTPFELYAKQGLDKISSIKELEFLENAYKNDPESLELVLNMKRAYKALSKIKYKQPKCLASFKKAQQSLHNSFMITLDDMFMYLDDLGFKELKGLISEGMFGCYPVDRNPEKITEGSITASNLLQRLFPDLKEDEEPEIFFLGIEFLSDKYEKPAIYNAEDREAADTNNIYLHKCFTLPNINGLSLTELQTVRNQLQEMGSLFRQNTDEWIDMCYFNDEVTERVAFFKNSIITAAQTVQQSIADNSLLQLCNRHQNGNSQVEVWMGEIPVWQLWSFYKNHDVIKEETWSKLENLKTDEAYQNQRWPVMMLGMCPQPVEPIQNDEPANEIKRSKKYILVD